jgi:hypothetical protein
VDEAYSSSNKVLLTSSASAITAAPCSHIRLPSKLTSNKQTNSIKSAVTIRTVLSGDDGRDCVTAHFSASSVVLTLSMSAIATKPS